METTYDTRLINDRAAWGAVLSMALCVSVLIASEFMPVSLLSPIATDLGITEGRTGQAISISGAFAMITSLLVAGLTRPIDRKLVVIGFTLVECVRVRRGASLRFIALRSRRVARNSEFSAVIIKLPALDRRTLLAAAFATAVLPHLAHGQQGRDPASQEPTDMRIKMTFDGRTVTATLYDNPSARDFFSMLPLDLTIEDFSSNEKIAHLPRKLTEEGSGPFVNEKPYDLCYFMSWGNLAMFYADYRHPGLIRLGRFDEGYEALHVRGEFPLRIEAVF